MDYSKGGIRKLAFFTVGILLVTYLSAPYYKYSVLLVLLTFLLLSNIIKHRKKKETEMNLYEKDC